MKTLKRICTFYLDRWWLPPICIPLWIVSAYFVIDVFELTKTHANTITDTLIITFMIFFLGLGMFILLTTPISWVWLLLHKKWLKALGNFLLTAPVLFIFYLACHAMYLNHSSK